MVPRRAGYSVSASSDRGRPRRARRAPRERRTCRHGPRRPHARSRAPAPRTRRPPHLEVGKRDRASAGAHGPRPEKHLSTAMIVATWTRSPAPCFPCACTAASFSSTMIAVFPTGRRRVRTSHPLADPTAARSWSGNSVPFCHEGKPVPSPALSLVPAPGDSRAVAGARGVQGIGHRRIARPWRCDRPGVAGVGPRRLCQIAGWTRSAGEHFRVGALSYNLFRPSARKSHSDRTWRA